MSKTCFLNSICEFELYSESNKKYANTINLVLFQAKRPYKNIQKYWKGLENWSKYHEKYFHDYQLQLFVDSIVLENEYVQRTIDNLISKTKARVIIFKCPKYQLGKYHRGLFATMIRFFPLFDINPHLLKTALIYDVEPSPQDLIISPKFFSIAKPLIEKNNIFCVSHTLTILHPETWYQENLLTFFTKDGIEIPYPHFVAGRIELTGKMPFSLFTNFIDRVDAGESFRGFYHKSVEGCKEKGDYPYCYGIDEIFLNDIMLPWIVRKGYGVGVCFHISLGHVLSYWSWYLSKDKRSKDFLNYVLYENEISKKSYKILYKEFNKILFEPRRVTKKLMGCAQRFWEILVNYDNWLPKPVTEMLFSLFPGIIYSETLLIVKDGILIDQIETKSSLPRIELPKKNLL